MTRRLVLPLLLLAAPAAAEPTAETLHALALAGDVPAVEAAFDDAFAAVRAGDLPADDLRAMTEALMVSDDRVRAFVETWLAAEPDSPHPHAVLAFQLRDEGFRLRGGEVMAWTYPEAVEAFHARLADSMDLARRAIALAPDHPPSIDAVLSLQTVTGAMAPDTAEDFLRSAMEATHDRGVLVRATALALPQWGGGGLPEVARLCAEFAPLVEGVPGYTADHCVADALFTHPFQVEAEGASRTVLAAPAGLFDHDLRLRAAINLHWESPETAELARTLVEEPGLADLELALNYDTVVARPRGWPLVGNDVLARAQARAWERLDRDPHHLVSIDLLLGQGPFPGPPGLPEGLSPEEALRLARLRVEAAPYDPDSWATLAGALAANGATPEDPRFEASSINAVAYSNHRPLPLMAYVDHRGLVFEGLSAGDSREVAACEVVRADRLLREVCASAGPREWVCAETDFLHPRWSAALDYAEAGGLCEWDRAAPLAMIALRPRALPEG